jgi:Mg2+ and Co2+ transporter CorA
VADISEIDRKGDENFIRWINCEGRSKEFLRKLGEAFHVHPIAIEDMQEIPQRNI